MGSLYLQKNTLILWDSRLGRFCTMRLMLRSATYCTSGCAACARVISGGASLRQKLATISCDVRASMYIITILTADSTTAGFWCTRRGVTRSTMFSASRASDGV